MIKSELMPSGPDAGTNCCHPLLLAEERPEFFHARLMHEAGESEAGQKPTAEEIGRFDRIWPTSRNMPSIWPGV